MVKVAALTCALIVGGASAFAPSTSVPSDTRATLDPLYENFGLNFAEDQAENTPDVILGEANYKQWVDEIQDNSFLNRRVRIPELTGYSVNSLGDGCNLKQTGCTVIKKR